MRGGYDNFRVTGSIALATSLDGSVRIEEMEVSALQTMFGARGTQPGTFTRLVVDGQLWMSDTQAEYRDHVSAIVNAKGRVLLNGLGLGCVLKAILAKPEVTHVDVIESDQRVVDLMRQVAPWVNDPRVEIHVADAYEQAKAWPVGTRWDAAWHDIWLDLCEDNLPEMARLKRSYGRRVDWQGAWGQELLQYHRRASAAGGW